MRCISGGIAVTGSVKCSYGGKFNTDSTGRDNILGCDPAIGDGRGLAVGGASGTGARSAPKCQHNMMWKEIQQ